AGARGAWHRLLARSVAHQSLIGGCHARDACPAWMRESRKVASPVPTNRVALPSRRPNASRSTVEVKNRAETIVDELPGRTSEEDFKPSPHGRSARPQQVRFYPGPAAGVKLATVASI